MNVWHVFGFSRTRDPALSEKFLNLIKTINGEPLNVLGDWAADFMLDGGFNDCVAAVIPDNTDVNNLEQQLEEIGLEYIQIQRPSKLTKE